MGRCERLHALELLQSALCLPGLARLVAETPDKRVNFRNPPVLLFIARLLCRKTFGALFLEGGVVSLVGRHPPALDV